jgi:DNA polymerase-3 subunit gamma/tau
MVLVRLVYAAELPTPDDLIGRLMNQPGSSPAAAAPPPASRPTMVPQARLAEVPRSQGAPQAMLQPAPAAAEAMPSPKSYAELIALAAAKRDLIVKYALEGNLSPVSFADGRIEVVLSEGADPGILQTLSARLRAWTGKPWLVTMSTGQAAAPTLKQLARQREQQEQARALEDPLVQAILATFPGAKLTVEQALSADMPPVDPEDPGFSPDPDLEEDDDE